MYQIYGRLKERGFIVLYHVLGGSLSAINGIGMEELTITKLVKGRAK